MNIKKVLLIILAVLFLIPILYVGYLYVTYLEEYVTTGSGYGFTIGEGKEDVFNKLSQKYGSKVKRYRFYKDREIYSKDKIEFSDEEYNGLKGYDKWKFYFDEKHIDYLAFYFEEDNLVKIERHRQYFELP
ncbi:hypothetical protein [Nitrospina watsonii]|uniref:DUF3139 domain-containing protein n=1 Tax=Nitrospina watsonii TaxID=1323948 RepID=A0ABM9HF05_9BACT|nr:hypothetical protein [Nitrospina watsonii]CAI2718659.1 conserved protein of unknown function [Nitrospina watsonii]